MASGKQRRVVQAWTELHRNELVADWQLAINANALARLLPYEVPYVLGCEDRRTLAPVGRGSNREMRSS